MNFLNKAGLLAAFAFCAHGQTAPDRSFDVASVKKSDGACVGRAMEFTPGRLVLRCVTLRSVIQLAWNELPGSVSHRVIRAIGGPSWLNSTQFDIEAKAAGASSAEMVGAMLQDLLKRRFQLQFHKEPKESPVYLLTATDGGAKLKPADSSACVVREWSTFPPPPPSSSSSAVKYCGTGSPHGTRETQVIDYYSVDMASFAATLQADREVVDRTGITGTFDIHLEYARMGLSGPVMLNGVPSAPVNGDPTGAVSIFTALPKETGLKLVAGTAPLDVIVVDHVELPSEN